jgi:hypothetical protein
VECAITATVSQALAKTQQQSFIDCFLSEAQNAAYRAHG